MSRMLVGFFRVLMEIGVLFGLVMLIVFVFRCIRIFVVILVVDVVFRVIFVVDRRVMIDNVVIVVWVRGLMCSRWLS